MLLPGFKRTIAQTSMHALEKHFIQADTSDCAVLIRCLTLWTGALKQSHLMLQICETHYHSL